MHSDDNTAVHESLYANVRHRAMMFVFMPGEQINESELSRELGVSRTPLRSALNRLEAEGFLVRGEQRGFRCRNLDVKSITDFYETRCEIEIFAVQKFCERGELQHAEELLEFCLTDGRERLAWSDGDQLDHDETFHCKLVALTGNSALVSQLRSVNGKIRFVRWLDMSGRTESSSKEHVEIAKALCLKDSSVAERLLRKHIERRAEAIHQIVKTGFLRLHVGSQDAETQLANSA